MKTEILKQEKNPFLHREEIIMKIESDAVPSFEDVKKEVGKDEKLTIVKKINSNFGRHEFEAEVVVYESEESKDKVETVPQKVRKKLAEEKKKAEEEKAKAESEAKAAEEKAKEEAKAAEETPAEEEKEDSEDKAEVKEDGN